MGILLLFLFCLFFLVIYFSPSFIAIGRKHTYALQITLLNALLGWSIFGWAAALIWATTNHIDENSSQKLSWVIIGIFFTAILFPILFFASYFTLSSYKLETEPSSPQVIQYKVINFKLVPEKMSIEKIEKKDNHPSDGDKD